MKKFKKVYIEITNTCNLSCTFCPKTERPPRTMDLASFTTVIEKVQEAADTVFFHIMGEPLSHPLVGEFLDICHHHKLRVVITTNGTLLAKRGGTLLGKPSLKRLNISLHSLKDNNEYILEDEYLSQVCSFINEAETSSFKIAIRFWNLHTKDSYNSNLSLLQKLLSGIGSAVSPEEVLKTKSYTIRENLFINQAPTFTWPHVSLADGNTKGSCLALREQVGILADGTVVPCCLDNNGTINLGNIFQQSLEEIIQSPRAQQIFRNFSNGRVTEQLCQGCSFRTKFN